MRMLTWATYLMLVTIGQVNAVSLYDDHSIEDALCNSEKDLNDTTITLQSNVLYLVPPGNFCLVENVANLTIRGDSPFSSTTVKCLRRNDSLSSRGFGFFKVVNLRMENIAFEDCGGVLTPEAVKLANTSSNNFYFAPGRAAVLDFNHCNDFTVENVSITKYIGFAIIVLNPVGDVLFNNLSVTNNINVNGSSPQCTLTGICRVTGMLLKFFKQDSKSSEISGNITLSNSLFYGNRAHHVAMKTYNCTDVVFDRFSAPFFLPVILPNVGALTVVHEQLYNVSVNVVNTSFVNNQGLCFGSVAILFFSRAVSSKHTFSNCTFRNNTPSSDDRVGSGQNFFGSALTVYMVLDQDDVVGTCLTVEDSKFYRDINPDIHALPFISISQLPGTHGDSRVLLSNIQALSDSSFLHAQHVDGSSNLVVELVDLHLLGNHTFSVESAYQDDSTITNGIIELVNLYRVSLFGSHNASCVFKTLLGPVIVATATNLELSGNISFIDNHGYVWVDGTAIRLQTNSYLWLKEPSYVLFNNNTGIVGGAIYSTETQTPFCSIQYSTKNVYTYENISKIDIGLTFINNSAYVAGNSVLITRLYHCSVQISQGMVFHPSQISYIYDSIFHFGDTISNGLREVSSRPYSVCLCDPKSNSSSFNCNESYNSVRTYPGKTISFGMISLDNNNSPVYALVFAVVGKNAPFNNQLDWTLGFGQDVIQMTGIHCSLYNFTIFSKDEPTSGELGFLLFDSERTFTVPVELTACPPGFQRAPGNNSCGCSQLLQHFDVQCDIDTEVLTRPKFSWIGIINSDQINETKQIGFAHHCSLRYCSPLVQTIDLKDPNSSLCDGNRTGILCGQCAPPLSTVVGDGMCMECSHWYLFTLPLYAIAGLLLVVVLFLLRLTVTPGTINGLVFYANVLYLNRRVFFGTNRLYWLKMFIAIINLRLGFPLCLYDGMTTVVSSHLSYLFPVYLGVVVIVIIVISRYSVRIAHLIGRSAVPILASLIYMSYTNLFNSVVDALSYSRLYFEDSNGTIDIRSVWYSDGNVDYLTDGHLSLFIIAIITLLFFLIPYTVLLTGVKHFSRYRFVNRFRPLIDAYCAPYKDKWRFWFGARLWVLIAIYITYAVSRNDVTTLFFVQCLILAAAIVVQLAVMPFKSFVINILDAFLMTNALFLSIVGMYTQELDKIRIGSAILVGLVFLTTIGIIVYHIWDVTGRKNLSLCFQRVKAKNIMYRRFTSITENEASKEPIPESASLKPKTVPTYQVLSYHPDQLRESVMDSVIANT